MGRTLVLQWLASDITQELQDLRRKIGELGGVRVENWQVSCGFRQRRATAGGPAGGFKRQGMHVIRMSTHPDFTYMLVDNESDEGTLVLGKIGNIVTKYRDKQIKEAMGRPIAKTTVADLFRFVISKKQMNIRMQGDLMTQENVENILMGLKISPPEITELCEFMAKNFKPVSNTAVRCISMSKLQQAIELFTDSMRSNSATSQPDPTLIDLPATGNIVERSNSRDAQLLEASAAFEIFIMKMQQYENKVEAVMDGHLYQVGDFMVSVGTYKQRSRVKALVVEVEYKPCSSSRGATALLKEFLLALGPEDKHKHLDPTQVADQYRKVRLPDEHTARHTAAQYVLLFKMIRQ